ncbi:transcription antitermination factor NusB [Flavobacterium silvaticum]|uniref:Transcription antitermination factor NusB n=1 Tax=Flavobacterium silvaticum TaxID=1852020 RepID=A0A972FRD1_9FLAO|nr:transcription antitermination factor NusB [Flavobacterium silvaticum]NMH27964.1 transcription antitermination factor NusB [Flavobacterium silvaticum]
MQSIYAMHQNSSDDLIKEEKFLLQSLDNIQDLYLIMLSTLTEMRQKEMDFIEKSRNKHLSTPEERNPNLKFVNNRLLQLLDNDQKFSDALENRKINNWRLNDDYILILLKAVKESDLYANYMTSSVSDFASDTQFIHDLFTQVIVPNEKLYDYLEDYKLTWVDDIPVVNTQIARQLKMLQENENFVIPQLYKDEEDKDFAIQLLRRTALNEETLAKEFEDKTPNWDTERIAEIDTIILKMAICEFQKFPSIPVKVTINEYLEIAKEYSTSKSSIFINGILDNLVKEYQTNNKLNKTGRGLM